MKAAIIYMLAIVGAELVVYVFVQPVWGVVFHIVILVAVIMHSAIFAFGEMAQTVATRYPGLYYRPGSF